jgi:molecular chaperone GrpE
VAEKHKLTDHELAQADGIPDDDAVTDNADSADGTSPERQEKRSGLLPMEPDDQKAARLQAELDETRDKMLRLAAEFDNFRKRVARERVELTDRAQANLASRLLDVLDDLDRLGADGQAGQGTLFDAMQLITRKLRKELESAGLERVEPTGQPFDPTKHEAVSTLPPPAPEQDHMVSATFQPGYTFKGSMIRPARVQVYSEPGQN